MPSVRTCFITFSAFRRSPLAAAEVHHAAAVADHADDQLVLGGKAYGRAVFIEFYFFKCCHNNFVLQGHMPVGSLFSFLPAVP